MIYNILFLILAYLIGSFPSALVIGKLLKGIDVREYGSKNLGSTNAVRTMGLKIGLLVFILDLIKPMIILLIVKFNLFNIEGLLPAGIFGIVSCIGHSYPIFARFKGGKCVASSLGIVLCLSPICGVIAIISFLINMLIHGYVSVSSTISTLLVLISYIFIYLFFGGDLEVLICFILLCLLICYRHIPNYKRLIKGEEKSFKKRNLV